jgi:hypothetical protein
MANLIGFAHQSGGIVFGRRENPWAFRRMDDELKSGQENRIKFDPSLAPVVLEPSPNSNVKEMPWLEETRLLLQTAKMVYLQRSEDLLRFRQSVHQLTDDQKLITLGSQTEVHHFTCENWRQLSHFYATKRDGFRFDIDKVVARDKDQTGKFDHLEIQSRLGPHPDSGLSIITFDATGSNVHIDLITWRKTVADGESGRFSPTNGKISLAVANYRRPFTFCEEYHSDFKSRWFIFTPSTVQSWIDRVKRKQAMAH